MDETESSVDGGGSGGGAAGGGAVASEPSPTPAPAAVAPAPDAAVPEPYPEAAIILTLMHGDAQKLVRCSVNDVVEDTIEMACSKFFLTPIPNAPKGLRHPTKGFLKNDARIGDYDLKDRDVLLVETDPRPKVERRSRAPPVNASAVPPPPLGTPETSVSPSPSSGAVLSSLSGTPLGGGTPLDDSSFASSPASDSGLLGDEESEERLSVIVKMAYKDHTKLMRINNTMTARDAITLMLQKLLLPSVDPSIPDSSLPYELFHRRLEQAIPPGSIIMSSVELMEAEPLEMRSTIASSRISDLGGLSSTVMLQIKYEDRSKLMAFDSECTVLEATELACGKFFLDDASGFELFSDAHGGVLAPVVLADRIRLSKFGFGSREEVVLRQHQVGGGAVGMRSSAVLKTIESFVIICVIHDETNAIKLFKMSPEETAADVLAKSEQKFLLEDVSEFELESERHGVLGMTEPLGTFNFKLKEKLHLRKRVIPGPMEGEGGLGSGFAEASMRMGILSPEAGGARRFSTMFEGHEDDDDERPDFLKVGSGGAGVAAAAAAAAAEDVGKTEEEDWLSSPAEASELFRRLLVVEEDAPEGALYQHDFLMTYRSFVHPMEVFQLCVMEIHPEFIAEEDLVITPLHNDPVMEAELPREKRSRRAFEVLLFWMNNHFHDFSPGSDLRRLLRLLIEFVETEELPWIPEEDWAKVRTDIRACFETCLAEDQERRAGGPAWIATGEELIDWTTLEVKDVAEQVTKYELELFQAIRPEECLGTAWTGEERARKAPNITKLIGSFNNLSSWVITVLVREKKIKSRVKTLKRVIELMSAFMELKNFNGCMWVLAALRSSPIARLAKTWAKLDEASKSALHYLGVLMAQERNYAFLRRTLSTTALPALPYLGLYLSDLVFINDGNPDRVTRESDGEKLVNFSKWRSYARVVAQIRHYQNSELRVVLRPRMRHWIETGLEILGEDEVYALSLEREPRKKKKKKRG